LWPRCLLSQRPASVVRQVATSTHRVASGDGVRRTVFSCGLLVVLSVCPTWEPGTGPAWGRTPKAKFHITRRGLACQPLLGDSLSKIPARELSPLSPATPYPGAHSARPLPHIRQANVHATLLGYRGDGKVSNRSEPGHGGSSTGVRPRKFPHRGHGGSSTGFVHGSSLTGFTGVRSRGFVHGSSLTGFTGVRSRGSRPRFAHGVQCPRRRTARSRCAAAPLRASAASAAVDRRPTSASRRARISSGTGS
jgi:hypothetical protein